MFVPDPNAFAEICFVLPDGGMWRAIVNRGDDGWELKFGRTQRTDGFIPAGTFKHGKALVKFIREKALEKTGSKDLKPVYDSLSKLLNRNPMNVVPDCYEKVESLDLTSAGRGRPECRGCPYRTTCSEPSAQPIIIPDIEIEESDEVFRHRLAAKMRDQYGKFEKPESIRDAAKSALSDLEHADHLFGRYRK